METFDGYGITVTYDGATLRVRGHSKVARVALMGRDRDQELVLRSDDIEGGSFRSANPLVNGSLTVGTLEGRKHVLHFRRKHQRELAALAEDLGI